jgi:hypothetical protein
MKSKLALFTMLATVMLTGCTTQSEQNLYQSQNYSFEFQYPAGWYVKESDQRILISPDSDFDSTNQMIGENAPVEIYVSNESVIDNIIQNYDSTPEKTYIADRKAEQISYEGLGQTFTVISIKDGGKFVEIWQNKTDEDSNNAFQLIHSTLEF